MNADRLNELLCYRPITGIEVNAEYNVFDLQCADDRRLRFYACPRVTFVPDDIAQDMEGAAVSHRLERLVGHTITGVGFSKHDGYHIHIGEFAIVSAFEGQSARGGTGAVIGTAESPFEF